MSTGGGDGVCVCVCSSWTRGSISAKWDEVFLLNFSQFNPCLPFWQAFRKHASSGIHARNSAQALIGGGGGIMD